MTMSWGSEQTAPEGRLATAWAERRWENILQRQEWLDSPDCRKVPRGWGGGQSHIHTSLWPTRQRMLRHPQ